MELVQGRLVVLSRGVETIRTSMVLRWLAVCLGQGPANALVSGTDCQGKENAGEEQNSRDMATNAQRHIK